MDNRKKEREIFEEVTKGHLARSLAVRDPWPFKIN